MDILPYKWIVHLEKLVGIPESRADLEYKYEDFLDAIEECCEDSEYDTVFELVEFWKRSHMRRLTNIPHKTTDLSAIQHHIRQMKARNQVAQRTDEWYKQASTVITASEFSSILKTGRTRGHLVLKKAHETVHGDKSLVVLSEHMTPFDWGIRFEPVIKRLYEIIHMCTIDELGRITHTTHTNIAASPDGIITDATDHALIGRLVEFKCPVTRSPTDKIPEDYYIQMQIQCEVTDTNLCDYVEAQFRSTYKNAMNGPIGPAYFFAGTIWIAEKNDAAGFSHRYIYSEPIRTNTGGVIIMPELEEDEHIVETIPWELMSFSTTTVKRDPVWFEKEALPAVKLFWEDVAAAKSGTYMMPESKRKARKEPVQNECLFIES